VGRRQIRGYRRFWSCSDRGAVLLEAALITPIFVMLLFGIWTTARAWNVHNVLDHASREAARFGATGRTHTEILLTAQGEVIAASFPWADVDHCVADIKGGTVTFTRNDGNTGACMTTGSGPGQDPTSDDRVQVTLIVEDYPLNFVFWNTTVDLQARAVARLEP
jgi:Flp pilus assembly protein TadG